MSDNPYYKQYLRGAVKSKATQRNLSLRSGARCYVCEFAFLDVIAIHHIKPLSKNGEGWLENLVRLCPNCHAMVHRVNRWSYATIAQRRDSLLPFDIAEKQAHKIALLSTEEVIIDETGMIWPRTRIMPEEALTYGEEMYQMMNWRPESNVGDQ